MLHATRKICLKTYPLSEKARTVLLDEPTRSVEKNET